MKDPVGFLDQRVPPALTARMREAYRSGYIQPMNALAELRMQKLIPVEVDALDVGTWLRCGA